MFDLGREKLAELLTEAEVSHSAQIDKEYNELGEESTESEPLFKVSYLTEEERKKD